MKLPKNITLSLLFKKPIIIMTVVCDRCCDTLHSTVFMSFPVGSDDIRMVHNCDVSGGPRQWSGWYLRFNLSCRRIPDVF